ncbi:transposable element Tcb2 transposase [Trichonephila clavipes]|nr:transposable element Tcb2 transposase [Trichonephila clavipes]
MNACKCIVPSHHGGSLNSRRTASPLVRLVEGEEKWEVLDHPQGVLPQNWVETMLNRSVTSMVLKALYLTRSTIRSDVGVAIVPQTISRHLAEANLKSKRPFRALPLTPEHRQLRRQWCQSRSMWNVTDWQKVVFRDESRFVLGTYDNRVRVWRRSGERYNSPHTVLRHTASTAGVMVGGHSL